MEDEVKRFVALASEMIVRIDGKPKDWHRDVARLSYHLEVRWRAISPPPQGDVRWPSMLIVEVDADESIPRSGFYSEIIETMRYRELPEKWSVWGVAMCLMTDPFTGGASESGAWHISDTGKTEINAEFASNVAECLSTWIRWIETFEERPVKKVRGRKPGRKLGDRNPDAKENAVIKAHRRGQNHEETAKIANVFNKDGRPDTRRVNRILRAYKRANPGHEFSAPNS